VRQLVKRIADRGAPIMANRTLALIRKILNFGISRGWLATNPAAGFPPPGLEQSRERVLTEEEIRLVWTASQAERPALRDLTRLRLITAQRAGELQRMTWADLDLENGWWIIPGTTRTRMPHRVPLSPLAIDILNGLRTETGSRWVFTGRTGERPLGDVKKAGRRITRRIAQARPQARHHPPERFDFRGHDLRRTAARYMLAGGVPRLTVKTILSYAESDMTAVDDRDSYDVEKRAALDWWAAKLQAILDRKSDRVLPLVR
jgi:integrase